MEKWLRGNFKLLGGGSSYSQYKLEIGFVPSVLFMWATGQWQEKNYRCFYYNSSLNSSRSYTTRINGEMVTIELGGTAVGEGIHAVGETCEVLTQGSYDLYWYAIE